MRQQVEVAFKSEQPYTSVHDEDLAISLRSSRLSEPRLLIWCRYMGYIPSTMSSMPGRMRLASTGSCRMRLTRPDWNMQGSVTDSCAITPRWKGAHSSRAIASKALAGTHRTNHIDIQQVVRQSRPGSMTTLDKLSPSLTRMIRIAGPSKVRGGIISQTKQISGWFLLFSGSIFPPANYPRSCCISTVLCYASGMLWPLTDHRETCSRAAMEAL